MLIAYPIRSSSNVSFYLTRVTLGLCDVVNEKRFDEFFASQVLNFTSLFDVFSQHKREIRLFEADIDDN